MRLAQRRQGFSLLEAIVSLALLATAGLALFSWINASFEGLQKIETTNKIAAAEMNAIEYLKTINVSLAPSGQTEFALVSMRWTARAVSEPTRNRYDTGGTGPFTVTLFDTEVSLEGPDFPIHRFVVRQMGYTRDATVDDLFGETKTRGIGTSPPANAATSSTSPSTPRTR